VPGCLVWPAATGHGVLTHTLFWEQHSGVRQQSMQGPQSSPEAGSDSRACKLKPGCMMFACVVSPLYSDAGGRGSAPSAAVNCRAPVQCSLPAAPDTCMAGNCRKISADFSYSSVYHPGCNHCLRYGMANEALLKHHVNSQPAAQAAKIQAHESLAI
jgi:hypothetical protein